MALRTWVVGAAVALGVAAAPPVAAALPASGERATVDVEFTTTAPGAPTGLTYRSQVHAPGGGEPPVLRRLIVGTPPGAAVDTSVPGRCKATDDQLRTQGDDICPQDSFVGAGQAEVLVTGLGRQRFTVNGINDDGQQLNTVKQGEMVSAVIRGTFTAEGLDALIPTCVTGGQPPSGCPFDQVRLLSSELVVPPYVTPAGSYFTTPPACPPSGRWRSQIVMTYADGVTERLFPEQPCAGAGREGAPPPVACRSRRRVVFAALARVGLRSFTAVLRGRRLRLDPRRPVLDLRGLPRGRYAVRVRAVTRSGKRLRFTRRYRTCG
jgi:hypothetical protein